MLVFTVTVISRLKFYASCFSGLRWEGRHVKGFKKHVELENNTNTGKISCHASLFIIWGCKRTFLSSFLPFIENYAEINTTC